jgi:glutamate racemase
VSSPRRPVAVFDSGIGGLTFVKALTARAPDVPIVYFGDTARLPYGTKSEKTIVRQSLECLRFLLQFDPEVVVVACNTASSIALPDIERAVDRPVFGVIDAAVGAALARTTRRRIGVIGTSATIRSGGYERRLRGAGGEDLAVTSRPCPLFVPLVEEGWIDHEVTRLVAREYLAPILDEGVDVLILACTHYPLLAPILAEVCGPDVALVDTGAETAREVAERLSGTRSEGVAGSPAGGPAGSPAERIAGAPANRATGAPANGVTLPRHHFYVSDVPSRFEQNGARFLGRPLDAVTLVEQSDVPWYERAPREAR